MSLLVCLIFVLFPISYFFPNCLLNQLTDQWDGLAGFRHPFCNGKHEHRERQDHLGDKDHVKCVQYNLISIDLTNTNTKKANVATSSENRIFTSFVSH